MKMLGNLSLLVMTILLLNCSIFFAKKLSKSLPNIQESFLEMKEIDDFDNEDDADENKNEIQKLIKEKDVSKIAFTELKSKVNKIKNLKKPKKKKTKQIDELKYLKKKRNSGKSVKLKLFRIGKLNELLNNHHWKQSRSEGMTGQFSKAVASQGNKNADEFVSFLGFMRDSSYKGNLNVMDQDIKRFFK